MLCEMVPTYMSNSSKVLQTTKKSYQVVSVSRVSGVFCVVVVVLFIFSDVKMEKISPTLNCKNAQIVARNRHLFSKTEQNHVIPKGVSKAPRLNNTQYYIRIKERQSTHNGD